MTTIRRFCPNDFLRFSSVNLDHLTVNRDLYNYLKWIMSWRDYSYVAVAPGNRVVGYFLGAHRVDGKNGHWRGIAMAVSVVPQHRRLKLGSRLMRLFEDKMVKKMVADPKIDHYHIFLLVGVYNNPAIKFFKKIGYKVLRRIPECFIKDDEDGYEMSKEIDEERGPSFVHPICSSCIKRKQWTCSYVCLPYIV